MIGDTGGTPSISTLPWQPEWFFFYGTLMIPEVLRRVLDLPSSSTIKLYKASIAGYKMKMWGVYPALVKLNEEEEKGGSDGVVRGVVYEVQRKGDVGRLSGYEGENYRIVNGVEITRYEPMEEVVVRGSVFVWCGYPEELEDGEFDSSRFLEEKEASDGTNTTADVGSVDGDEAGRGDVPLWQAEELLLENPWSEGT